MLENFANALKQQLIERKKTRGNAGKIIDIINRPDSKRRTRILERLEAHARVHLEQSGVDVGDWTNVSARDWTSFFDGLLKLIIALLPLILKLFP